MRLLRKIMAYVRAIQQYKRKGGITYAKITTIDHQALLAGKTVLVTGGSQGIGLAIAKRFVASGARVLITGRTEADLQAACTTIASDRISWLAWDIADIASVEAKLDAAQAQLGGRIDILVNNAGVLLLDPFLAVSEATWDKSYAINSKGLFFLTQSLCKRWVTSSGSIRKVINISSTSGFLPGAYPYRMTKWDVVGMTQGFAQTLAPHNIIVNGIAPGRTAGRMLGIDTGNIHDNKVPLGRAALPEEIAELALFLAGDTSNYITGQTIVCDGGMTL